MSWYTANIIISCRLKHGHQKVYPIYENFTLFEAENHSDAIKKTESYSKKYAKVDDLRGIGGNVTLAAVRDATNSSRKFILPVLEYLFF